MISGLTGTLVASSGLPSSMHGRVWLPGLATGGLVAAGNPGRALESHSQKPDLAVKMTCSKRAGEAVGGQG